MLFRKIKKIKQMLTKEMIVDNEQGLTIQKVSVPDLKQYLVDGYNEIREVKQRNLQLEEQLEEASKNKQLYEAALVTLEEFKKRDKENQDYINKLKEKIFEKDNKIYELMDSINTYKIKEKEILKQEEKMKSLLKEKEIKTVQECKNSFKELVECTKGNISKSKLYSLINSIR